MTNYFLRVEGVNFDNFVYDTNELSTIRGGGLLLLEAVNKVGKIIEAKKEDIITKGASWGLIAFEVDNDDEKKAEAEAVELAKKLRDELQKDPQYSQATLTVEVLPADVPEKYVATKNKLATLSHWHQMQAPSLIMPESSKKQLKEKVCEFDHVRPAECEDQKAGKTIYISKSVSQRREHGKANKKTEWYKKITKLDNLPEFTSDFKELSECTDFGKLSNKMAVIYLDGNNFGKRQREYCTSRERQKKFDEEIRTKFQNGTLKTLLEQIRTDKQWLTKHDKLRFETLLWGGDEIIWVVPAWKGWEFLGLFFDQVEKRWDFEDKPLTLAAGLVFCHHNAPIQRIKNLARSLGDLAKGDRTENRVAYQVLESFDHAGLELQTFREKRQPGGISSESLILDGNSMLPLLSILPQLRKNLPKRQLHQLVDLLYAGADGTDKEKVLGEVIEKIITPQEVEAMQHCFGNTKARWLHLLELWDYIAPTPKGGQP